MLMLMAVISAQEECSSDMPECSGGQTHLHELSSRLRHVAAPPPFPPFIVRSTNELSPPNHQFSGILHRLKQVPCRGNNNTGVMVVIMMTHQSKESSYSAFLQVFHLRHSAAASRGDRNSSEFISRHILHFAPYSSFRAIFFIPRHNLHSAP
jgi:hypothetical protein